ncbi:Uncharacterised protein [uncultured archaeon]|nr:Uncharacterised protein [uncultured archaeon]
MKGQIASFEIFMLAVVGTTILSILAQQSSLQKEYYEERLDQASLMSSAVLFANTSLNTTKLYSSTTCYTITYENGTVVPEDSTCASTISANCRTFSMAERVTICGTQSCNIRVRSC